MIKVPVYSVAGVLVEEMQLDEGRLGGSVNRELMRQALIAYEAGQRQGNASTKTRGEVSHPDKKPWAQKHTGRARAGTPNSPIWVGGGVSHGPKPRDYSQKLNKKMRRRAVASAVLSKLQAGQVKIIQDLQLPAPKTKEMARIMKGLGADRTFLVVLAEHDMLIWRCTRNIPGAAMMTASELNAYGILRARDVIFTRNAFDEFLKAAPQAPALKAAAEASAAEDD